jgi:hypothetical protein
MMHGGPDLDPLIGLDNERTPLRGRLLAIPSLRAKYLDHVREIAESSLDWDHLGPIVAEQRALVEQAMKEDTKMLGTFEGFDRATSTATQPDKDKSRASSLKDFADKRRKYLLDYEEPKGKAEKAAKVKGEAGEN